MYNRMCIKLIPDRTNDDYVLYLQTTMHKKNMKPVMDYVSNY
jgi:hypothetical protein